nr:glycosyltransferase [Ignavibacteria bacterium]
MEIAVFIILSLYLLMHCIMFIGVLVNTQKSPHSKYEPKVSIVICARNEESSIEACILSLLNLNYPKDKLEVLLVNDRSEDRTKEIMNLHASANPC